MITKTTITNPLPSPMILPFVIIWIGASILVLYTDMQAVRMPGYYIGATYGRCTGCRAAYLLKNPNLQVYVYISMNVVIHFVIVVFVIINYN